MGGITRATVENPSTSAAGVGWSVMVGRDDVIHLTWWNGTASRYRAVQSGVWGDETTISTSNIMNGQIGRLDMAYQTMIFYVSGASIKAYDLSNLGDSPLTIYTDTATIDGISPVVGMYASGTTKILYHTTASKLRFVDVVVAPTAAFTWTPTTVYSQFTAVAFNSTGSFNGGDAGLSYAWDFESDGTIDSTIAMPFHVYYYAGTYNVTLHVYNSVDDDVAVHSITVIADTGGTPFAGFDPTANESLAIVILVSGALFLFVLAMMYRRR
jgi:PKD repeat protein